MRGNANKAEWTDGYIVLTGSWFYQWNSDRFYITLDDKDPVTGMTREICVVGDHPNFGKFVLVGSDCRIWPEKAK